MSRQRIPFQYTMRPLEFMNIIEGLVIGIGIALVVWAWGDIMKGLGVDK